MAKRLWYIITWPSAILCIIFAFWLLLLIPSWIAQSWMHIKLTFVVLLIAYHLKTHQIFLKLQKDKIVYTSMFMRIWNEGATLLLFTIVFLVILKDSFHWVFGLFGILGLGLILVLGIRLYKKIRMGK
jgi:putative membrane protein